MNQVRRYTVEPTEKQFLQAVIGLARIYRWRAYHTFDARRSTPGYPDLTLVRPPRLVVAELKTSRGVVTTAQREWLMAFAQVPGIEVFVWKPADWDSILHVLQ